MARKTRTRKRKQVPWAGWGKISPKGRERTEMKKRCGKKCFLGPDKSFPVCAKGTCRVSPKGAYAAYIRAREWGKSARSYKGLARPSMKRSVYTRVARKAKSILRKKGYKVGKSGKRRSRRSRSSMRRTRRGGRCGSCKSTCGRCSTRRVSRGGMSKCRKGSRHRLMGQTRHGRKIRKHGHYSRKCSKKRGRRSRSRSRRR